MNKFLLNWMLALLAFSTIASAEDKSGAVIILDASGSMWGQIEGVPKIDIAKETLTRMVRAWDPQVELGLTVYGQRHKGDCNDIETVIPLATVDKDKILSLVEKIQPKGKTPISRALQKVAGELKYTDKKSTIILISDGKESCDADPCAMAKSLEKEGVNFVAHVIGFDVDKETTDQLRCIAKNTGGVYFSADSVEQLNNALEEVTTKLKPVPSSVTNLPVLIEQTQFRVQAESIKTIDLDGVKSTTSRNTEYLLDATLSQTGHEMSLNSHPAIIRYSADLSEFQGVAIPGDSIIYNLNGRRVGGLSHRENAIFYLATLGIFSFDKLMLEIPKNGLLEHENWQVPILSSVGPVLINMTLVKLTEAEIEITFQSIVDNVELSKQRIEVIGKGTYNRKTLLVNKASWTEVVWLSTEAKKNGIGVPIKVIQRTHKQIQRNN